MRIHHLNCISTCPLGGRLMDGGIEAITHRAMLCCHCLLIETATSLVLVDTGLGLRDVRAPTKRLSRFFLELVSPNFREEMTALRQIQRLGYDPRDVKHIILTHLDFDHAGGLDDFPQATVHMMRAERDHAIAQATWLDRQRFRPQQWSTQMNWRTYTADKGDLWFGFERVHLLHGLPPEIVLIPLLGHTFGHAGVGIQRDHDWLLLAGDAYFFHAEMDTEHPRCTPGLRAYQVMMDKDRKARVWNQERLRNLRRTHGGEVDVFCAHDTTEFERLAGRSVNTPIEKLPDAVRHIAS